MVRILNFFLTESSPSSPKKFGLKKCSHKLSYDSGKIALDFIFYSWSSTSRHWPILGRKFTNVAKMTPLVIFAFSSVSQQPEKLFEHLTALLHSLSKTKSNDTKFIDRRKV